MPDKHYVTIKAAITKGETILLQKEKRSDGTFIWDLPGGRIDEGETIEAGLKRELYEEIGVTPVSISNLPVQVWSTKGARDGVVALLYRVEIDTDTFQYNNGVTDKVEEAKYLTLEEVQASADHIHKPFIIEFLKSSHS